MLSEICMAKKDHTCIWNPDTELRLTIERSKTEKTKEKGLENFSQRIQNCYQKLNFCSANKT